VSTRHVGLQNDEAERNRWTEGIVFRAVATKFACEESHTAGEAYELLDNMTRFAAQHGKRRRGGARLDDEVELMPVAMQGRERS